MNPMLRLFVCGAALLGPAVYAAAAPIIDQLQGDATQTVANTDRPGLAQSFQQTNDNIAGAGIYFGPTNVAPSTVTISVWDDLPNQPDAAMLASGSGLIVPGGFFDVFWTPVAITPGVTHYLVFEAPGSNYDLQGRLANVYPYGNAYANAGYVSYPNYDYAFRTYYEPVPEPVAWSLLAAGLASLPAARIVRRRATATR